MSPAEIELLEEELRWRLEHLRYEVDRDGEVRITCGPPRGGYWLGNMVHFAGPPRPRGQAGGWYLHLSARLVWYGSWRTGYLEPVQGQDGSEWASLVLLAAAMDWDPGGRVGGLLRELSDALLLAGVSPVKRDLPAFRHEHGLAFLHHMHEELMRDLLVGPASLLPWDRVGEAMDRLDRLAGVAHGARGRALGQSEVGCRMSDRASPGNMGRVNLVWA